MTTVSIVVNTYNRADSLRLTLEGLDQLDYQDFEVVVVDGPSTDGTDEVLAQYSDRIKVGRCANRNLSESRNIGIGLAAGEVVAFIDDDAYPDPAWLDRLVEGYSREEVAGVGGPVYDHTGASLQARYNLANRYADASIGYEFNPTPYVNYPLSESFAYLIGTNSSFRRRLLVEVGGFDEEYEYYLDETDLCCRLVDEGYVINALDDGFVYHKFLASDVRAPNRAIRNRFTVMKNRAYFALKHGLAYGGFFEVCRHLHESTINERHTYRENVAAGLLDESDYERFEADIHRAFDVAFERFLSQEDRTRPAPWFDERQEPFKRYRTRPLPEPRLHLCFLIQEYPPVPLNGIARVVHTLATGLAAKGHIVHVLTRGEDHDRVDLEDGVWVHRVVVRHSPRPAGAPDLLDHLWNYSASLCRELVRIHEHRPIDVVQTPNWDSEGAAAVLDGRFRTVVGLYTPIKALAAVDQRMATSPDAPNPQIDPLVDSERWLYRHADAVLACGPGIAQEIEHTYDVVFPPSSLGFVVHGLPDASVGVHRRRSDALVEVLFVGRLEARKGIDTLLEAIPGLAAAFPELAFTIVGNDRIPSAGGPTYRELFEASDEGQHLGDRVRFAGLVSDAERAQHYADCDIFVAPSRFESFGLILVEAMMFGKPVVGCDIGGMRDIVDDGETGFLVRPGDPQALHAAVAKLADSGELRLQLGQRARESYLHRFTVDRMVDEAAGYYERIARQVQSSPSA
ncbi:MAG TPA: glycosyltransferase [Acidimicrobiales bacterium]